MTTESVEAKRNASSTALDSVDFIKRFPLEIQLMIWEQFVITTYFPGYGKRQAVRLEYAPGNQRIRGAEEIISTSRRRSANARYLGIHTPLSTFPVNTIFHDTALRLRNNYLDGPQTVVLDTSVVTRQDQNYTFFHWMPVANPLFPFTQVKDVVLFLSKHRMWKNPRDVSMCLHWIGILLRHTRNSVESIRLVRQEDWDAGRMAYKQSATLPIFAKSSASPSKRGPQRLYDQGYRVNLEPVLRTLAQRPTTWSSSPRLEAPARCEGILDSTGDPSSDEITEKCFLDQVVENPETHRTWVDVFRVEAEGQGDDGVVVKQNAFLGNMEADIKADLAVREDNKVLEMAIAKIKRRNKRGGYPTLRLLHSFFKALKPAFPNLKYVSVIAPVLDNVAEPLDSSP